MQQKCRTDYHESECAHVDVLSDWKEWIGRSETPSSRAAFLLRISEDRSGSYHSALTTDLLALDDAVEQLLAFSERLGRLVEYRFFGGLTFEEIAEVSGQSVPTVKRDWSRARGWKKKRAGTR